MLDFDGTLSDLVDRPEQAAMHPLAEAALRRLIGMVGVTVAIISGRSLADIRTRVALPGMIYAGNHGLEIAGGGMQFVHPDALAAREALVVVREALVREIGAIQGAFVEDKGLTISVHVRLTPAGRHACLREAVARITAAQPGLLVVEGKQVLEIRPRVEWNKGSAVLYILERTVVTPGAAILYVGDDRTDEDAFRAIVEARWGEGICVADPVGATSATSVLRSPEEVGELLSVLGDLGLVHHTATARADRRPRPARDHATATRPV